MTITGYAFGLDEAGRASQTEALRRAGCWTIISEDEQAGAPRLLLWRLVAGLHSGDVVAVATPAALGSDASGFLEALAAIEATGAHLVILRTNHGMQLDTRKPDTRRLVLPVLRALRLAWPEPKKPAWPPPVDEPSPQRRTNLIEPSRKIEIRRRLDAGQGKVRIATEMRCGTAVVQRIARSMAEERAPAAD